LPMGRFFLLEKEGAVKRAKVEEARPKLWVTPVYKFALDSLSLPRGLSENFLREEKFFR